MSDSSKELVAEILLDNVSDDLLSSYIRLAGILTECGYNQHTDELEELYSQYNALNVDTLALQTHVDHILLNSLDIVLAQCGVVLSGDIDIDLRCDIADGILTFDISEELEIIKNKLENSIDDIDALTKVLSFTLALDIDTLMPAFESVQPQIVSRMRDMINQGLYAPAPEFNEVTVTEIVSHRFNKLRILKPETLGGQLAAEVEPADVSFESLYAYNARFLMKKEPPQAVDDLYSLAALGGLSLEDAREYVGLCLDDLYPDTLVRAKASRIALSVEGEYSDVFAEVMNEQV